MTDGRFQKQYPLLWEHLTQAVWDDGTARVTSGITFFTQDGMFKALLKDNDAGLCLWITAPGFFDTLAALEMALGSPSADWRVDRKKGGGVAKKK